MSSPRFRARLVLLLALSAGCRATDSAAGEPARRITAEWIYGDEAAAVDRLPAFAWRDDGRVLLWDASRGDAATIELLTPTTGARRDLVDRAGALESLGRALDDAPAFGWPDQLDDAGERALYAFEDDLFVLTLATSTFRRLTETPERETAASFSPDGRRVAFVRDNDLFVVDVDGGRETRLTRDGSETTLNGTLSWVYWEELFGRRDVGYWWSDDSRSIAYLQSDESPVGIAHFVDFRDPYPEVVRQRYPKAGTANPAVRVGVVPVDGSETTWIDVPAEHEYIARVQWLPDGRNVAVQTLTRDQRHLDLWFADASSGAARHVLHEVDEAWINIHDDLHFLRDGRFVWASERSGYMHLYLYEDDGRLVGPVTGGDWALASSGGGVFWLRQAVCAIDEDAGQVWFTALESSSIERQLYRIGLDGTGLERVSVERGTHAVTFAPDASRYLDRHSNLESLPSLSLHRADGTELARIARGRADVVAELDLQVPELLRVPAADGFEMPAWILKPRDFDPSRRYPLILYVYGGPSAPTVADAWDDDRFFDHMLLDAGYLVARCDNRASTAISKTLENTIAGSSIGDVERDDYAAAARWFKGLPFVDPERVGIWGWSGGGSMTLLMLTRSEEFRAGIAVAPVTDWRFYDTKWAEFAMKLPAENPEGYAHTNLVERAADLHGRLLLVHGTYDDNVHPQNAWSFVDRLVAAGIPFDLMMYPLRKHGIRDDAARIHLTNKMLEFWRQHL